ncbi:hypothetical protein A3758_14010 [Oleiphilus sp. HI0118]|nr:hypothetical protein A3758_14010 [Oleiphilus sp. HI0118]
MESISSISRRFTKLKLVSTVSAVLLLAACGGDDTDTEYQNHLDRAKAYQGQGQYKAAMIEYRNAAKKSGGNPEVMIEFADVMNEVGDHRNARAYLEAIPNESSEAYLLELAETYIALGKFQSADSALEKLTEPTREKMLLEAEILSKRGKLEESRAVYSKLAANNASDAKAMIGLATIDAVEGNMSSALERINKVSESEQAYGKAQLLKAGIQISENDLEGAEGTLSQLLSVLPTTDQMMPDRVLTLERLSYVLTRLGRSNEAYIYTKLLSEAFPGATEANDSFQEAMKDFEENRLDEAKEKLVALVERYPGHVRSRQVLGIISYMQGDAEAAARYLGDVVDPETSSPLATQVYMATNLKLNEPKRVLEALEPTIDQQTSVEILALYGLAAVSDGQYDKGEAAIIKAAGLAPKNVRLQLALASFYRSTPNADRSKELPHLQKAFELDPKQRQVLVDLASYYRRNGEQDKAKEILVSNAKKHADNYTANFIAGQFLATTGDIAESSMLLKNAAPLAKADIQRAVIQGALGRNALLENKNEEAKQYFEAMLELSPNSIGAYAGLYEAESRVNGQENALRKLAQRAREDQSLAAYQSLIRIALSNRNISGAERYYADAMDNLPDQGAELKNVKAVIDYSRAIDYLKTGQLDKARDVAARSLVTNPGNVRVVAVLAEVEIRSERFDEAEKMLAQLDEQAEQLGHILPALKGDLAMAKKEYTVARSAYEKAWSLSKAPAVAEKLHRVLGLLKDQKARSAFLADWYSAQPDNLLAMLLVGMESQQKGDVDKAQTVYETLLTQRPDSVAALNNLGWLYYEKGDERALDLLARAAELAPNSPAVLDSYGWVLHKFGKTAEGLPYLEKAAEMQPDNAEIQAHFNEAKAAG